MIESNRPSSPLRDRQTRRRALRPGVEYEFDKLTLGRDLSRNVVTRLLASHRVTSQEQLVELLAAEGVSSTQATVSRDLVDLGAIKVRAGDGESVYAIPEQPHAQRAPTTTCAASSATGSSR